MAKVYAVFEEDDALQRAIDGLEDKDYEILAPRGDLGQPREDSPDTDGAPGVPMVIGMSATGGSSTVVPIVVERDPSVGREEPEDYDRYLEDLPKDQHRRFMNALKEGAQILILKRADETTVQRLKDAGASLVSST
ncbi:hypothetical protein [Meiothermus granaticius]|uniref:General stress protein 17M-like domain-containing protein n=1 Tax=Meiothermus granaticius NBRC 107808 TaxID=1227551 RepID=A0A399FAS2_9DEIN|nr:hypothetical protein [Meiothermus granaticius]RIH92012.1 hypothetical protein Mgrana_02085 [Meiothermus granaticius NBRC 107808]GEM86873.1 hypothetical protein MGR01S_14980 [Meiothermus granaticius NBRC 107808]